MQTQFIRVFLSLALVLAGCARPPETQAPLPQQVKAATFSIDAVKAVEALGNRPNALWQDSLFTLDAVKQRRKTSPYHLETTALTPAWTGVLPSASDNGMAYAHDNTSYGIQAPHADEIVYAVCDDANGTIVRFNPGSSGAILTPNFTALSGLAGAGTVSKSAVGLSGNNNRIYLLTSGGYFVVLDAHSGTRVASVKLSSAGFAGVAPFVDYSNGGGLSYNDEFVYGLATDGSLYQMEVTNSSVHVTGWRAAGGTDAGALGTAIGATAGTYTISTTAAPASLAYGGTVVIKASPFIWNGTAVFGASNGYLYRVKTASGTVDGIQLSNYGIETTPSIDFDPSFTTITDVFVPAGDRLHWVNSSGSPMVRKSISPPLTLDHKPTSATVGTSGQLSKYAYTTAVASSNVPPSDWVSATTGLVAGTVGPTHWGGGSVELGSVTTPANPYGVTFNPSDNSIWCSTPTNNKIQQISTANNTITNTYDGNGNYAALVKTIPVGGGGVPTAVAPDPINGGVWVTCYGLNELEQINAAGTVVRTITGIPSPTALCYDQAGTTGVVGDDILWVASCTGTAAAPTGALLKVMISSGTFTSFNNTNTSTSPVAKKFTDAANSSSSNLTSANWKFEGPQGVAQDANGDVWVSNTWENMDVSDCNFCPNALPVPLTPGFPFNVDGQSEPTFSSELNSSILVFHPATSKFTAQVVTTGAPFNMAPYHDTATNTDSMWCATYRWGVDTTERIQVTNYNKLFESTQTTDHWQPHWVAVDSTNKQVWIVEGDANTAFTGTASKGLDCIKANSTSTGDNSMQTSNTNYIGTFTTGAQPRGVSVDSTGNVWVANASAQNCTKYSKTGADLGTYPVGATPWCVTCDKFDVTWVCNRTADTVSRISPATQPPAPFNNPRGIGLDSSQNLWVANSGDNTMTILDQTGNTVFLKLATGTSPYGVAGNNSGAVWVASSGSSSVNRFTATTGASTNLTPGSNPFWCALSSAGAAFITLPSANKIQLGSALGVLGATVNVGTNPQGIAVSQSNSDVWVANKNSNNVSYIAGGVSAPVNYGVGNGPSGVAVKNNQVWASNTSANSLTRLNTTTAGGRAAVGTGLGTVTGYTNANAPIHMAIDQNENLWVANSGSSSVTKIWGAGSQKDLMAASNYQGTDGNDSYSYLQYKIPNGFFGGKTIVGARVGLMPVSNSAMATETLNAYPTAVDIAGALWTGENSSNLLDWNNSPAIGTVAGAKAGAIVNGTLVNVPVVPVPVAPALPPVNSVYDFPNTTYSTTGGIVSYAVQSQGHSLQDVAHFDAVTTRPVLTVDLTTAKLGASGLRSQPVVDSLNLKIYMMGTNAVFEIPYDSAANFADPAKIAYSFSQQGVSVGPMSTAPAYITPLGATTETLTDRLVTIDYNSTGNQTGMSCFTLTDNPIAGGFFLDTTGNNSGQMTRSTISIPGQLTNSQLLFDYDQGSVYVAANTSVYAVKLLQ